MWLEQPTSSLLDNSPGCGSTREWYVHTANRCITSRKREKLETSGVTEPNQKSLYAGQGAENPLLKEVLEQARKGKWG